MLDSLAGQPRTFSMETRGYPALEMTCSDFMYLRQDEKQLLDSIALPQSADVLDFGCGIGRHLSHIRLKSAAVHCIGIDICDLMLDHCRQTFAAPATFANSLAELPGLQCDLIMLMGNGLGVLGDEPHAMASLDQLVRALRPGGRMVIEAGNPFGQGYSSRAFTIDYQEHHEGPFVWGYADRAWLADTMTRLGCAVTLSKSHAPGGVCFFAVAEKTQADPTINQLKEGA